MSGQKTRRFCFEAFLPNDKKEKAKVLEQLKEETRTIIIYEAPHRLVKTLKDLANTLGNREITLCRELTKKYEEALKTTLENAIAIYEEKEPRGEFVLVIAGKAEEEIVQEKRKQWESMSIKEHVEYYVNQGNDKKDAMKMAAKDRGVSKRDIYNALIEKT
jgi:16S rRNA (cytidine1402-2'-O)-methyltransferase